MIKEYEMDSLTLRAVLGSTADPNFLGSGDHLRRTSLYVEFGVSSAVDQDNITSPEVFNAVGSLAVQLNGEPYHPEFHLPVIDANYGTYVQARKLGSKAVLGANRVRGYHAATSLLRDVLGDNGIDLEIDHRNDLVRGIVLRAKEEGVFAAFESTQHGHGHLYIQRQFSGEDHRVLIQGLAGVGVIDERWQRLTAQNGMGIVRTPWAKKDITD